jgi:hypothetical protein
MIQDGETNSISLIKFCLKFDASYQTFICCKLTQQWCQTPGWRGGDVSQAEPGTSARGHLADRTFVPI